MTLICHADKELTWPISRIWTEQAGQIKDVLHRIKSTRQKNDLRIKSAKYENVLSLSFQFGAKKKRPHSATQLLLAL